MDLNTTDGIYNELVDSLEHLVKVYRTLLDVVRREKDILIASQLDELVENNKAKDAILLRIRSLENTRAAHARSLTQILGGDVEAPRLLDLATRLDSVRSDRLRNLHSVLELLVRRVSEVNKQNEELVKSALSHITGAMEAIRDTLHEKPTYARKGEMAAPKNESGSLVRKQV